MYSRFGKRVVDLIACVAVAPFFLIVAAIVTVATKLTDGGPVFFSQQRVGQDGSLFSFYKFRSMPVNAPNVASDQIAEVRLPFFFRLLRRSNIDELPQFLNVAKGQMSLIGPRPCLPSQATLVQLRRDNGAISCRPGLTGWAQVNSYDGMDVAAKARLDGEYCENISLAKDVKIIFSTFSYFLRPPPKY